MPRLYARSIACSAPVPPFTGSVHSVHERACNLTISGSNDNSEPRDNDAGIQTVVVTSSVDNVPAGLVVADDLGSPGFAFSDWVAVGMHASFRQGTMRIGPSLIIETLDATVWNDFIGAVNVDLVDQAHQVAWRTAWRKLGMIESFPDRDLGVEVDLTGVKLIAMPMTDTLPKVSKGADSMSVADLMPGFWPESIERSSSTLRMVCERLVGLGPGLTPAGDDLLVGYLAGLNASVGNCPERLAFAKRASTIMYDLLPLTNPVSRFYLERAMEGRVSEHLRLLIEVISHSRSSVDEIAVATTAAMAVGSSSGPAGVLGLLLGLAAWQPFWLIHQPANLM